MAPQASWTATARDVVAGENSNGPELMKELLRANDPVLISAVQALLDAADIGTLLLDSHMSVLEGSIGAIPRRLMVADDDLGRARDLLTEAGLGHELRP